MATIIDELQVNINAKYNTKSLGNMTKKLEDLGVAIQKLTAMTGGLQGVGNAIGGINQQISKLPKTNIKISQSASNVSSSYSNVRKVVDGVFKAMGDGAKSTINLMKKLSSAVVSLGKGGFNIAANSMKGLFTFILKSSNPLAFSIGKLSSGFKTLLGTMIGFYGIRSVFSWMKDAVVSGADVAETNHIVQETFQDLAGTVEQWSQTTMDQFGMTSIAAKRYAGVLSSMFQASNVEYKKAATMATDLTGLAGDLASFYNIDIATAYKKIQSGMAGQSRPLLALGIDMRVAALEAYRMEQGITKSYSAMNTAEKTMLRYQYLMSVTSKQQGDFARTAGSMANQLRTFKAYASAITSTIGDGLASALRHVIKYLNVFMSAVYQAVQLFATFMKTLFGANVSGGGFTLENDLGDIDDVTDDLSDSVSDASDGLGDAADNAKKLKKELSVLPFDELNQLNKPQESSGSSGSTGGSGAGGGGKSIGDIGTALFNIDDLVNQGTIPEAISAWAQQIRAAFENQQWNTLGNVIAMGINQAVEKVYAILDPQNVRDKVFPYIDAFTTTFNSLIFHLDFDMIGRTVGRGIEDILLIVRRLVTGINWQQLGQSWAAYFNGIFKEVDPKDVGGIIADLGNAVFRYLLGALMDIDWIFLGNWFSTAINTLISDADFNALADVISTGINGLADAFNELVDPKKGINFATLGIKLGTALVKMISDIKWERIGTLLGNLWNGAWELLKNFVIKLGNDGEGTGLGKGILTALQKAVSIAHKNIGDISDTITGLVKAVASDIADAFGDPEVFYQMGQDFGQVIGDVLGDTETWKKIAEAINNVTDGIIEFISGVLDAVWDRREEILNAIEGFLVRVKWHRIFALAAPMIAGAITTWVVADVLLTALKNKLTSLIVNALGAAGASSEVAAAANGALTTAAEATTAIEGTGAAAGAAAGTLGFGALAAALLVGGRLLTVYLDTAKGGNGILTETGRAVDNFAQKMQSLGFITDDTYWELYNLKEEWESGKISDEDFVSRFSEALVNAGVSAEDARTVIQGLGGDINGLTENEITALLGLVGQVPSASKDIELAFDNLGRKGHSAFADLIEATTSYTSQVDSDSWSVIDRFNAAMEAGRDAGLGIDGAFRAAIGSLDETAGEPEIIYNAIKENLPPELYDVFIKATGDATHSVEEFTKSASKSPDTSWSNGISSVFDTAKEKVNNAATSAWNWLTATSTTPNTAGIDSATTSMETNAEKTGAAAERQEAYNEAANNTPTASTNAATTIVSVITTLLSALGIRVAVKTAAKDAPYGVSDAFSDNKDKVKTRIWITLNNILTNAGNLAKKDAETQGENAVQGYSDGMENKFPTIIATTEDMCQSVVSTTSNLMDEHSPSRVMAEHGKNIILGLVDGINTSQTTLTNSMTGVLGNLSSSITNAMSGIYDSMYTAGHNAMQSFANGLSNVRVKVPHIYVSGWNTTYYGNGGWFQTPNFGVSWYGKGGLFTSPSLVAGLGEAGNEAVLPLENKRTMGMIADAITNNGSSIGMNAEDLQEAVATGVAMAMAQNPQTVQINVHSELRTNDETLAESVSRGQARLDRRYNATTAYSY